jgi:Protein of unknown function (DUF2950)
MAMTNHLRERRLRSAAAAGVFALSLAAIFALSASSPAFAQHAYATPDDAVNALIAFAKSGDARAAYVIFGPGGEDIVSSGDKVSDDALRAKFLDWYDAKHQIKADGADKATLIVGEDDFPFPIPLVRKGGKWMFDTNAGLEEILDRRIGQNELDAIETSLAYVDAQEEYASKDRTGAGVGVYAQRFVSDPGKKDGLYWPAAKGEEESPLGELFAEASQEGYHVGGGRSPYHGYYYKILTKQGSNAPGGAVDYVVNGQMIGGYGLVAYPAEYRNSGVMTFMVSFDGDVFQKDLGPNTAALAERITAFDPDASWKKVEAAEPAK